MVSDNEKEKIREEARALLESFAKKLEKVKLPDEKKEKVMKNSGMREEGDGEEVSEEFKKRVFDNAPKKSKKYILAEKKKW